MHETPAEMERLRQLLDRSAAGAGAHLRSIASDDRRLTAEQVCARLTGMRLLVLATVTADGRPLTGPIDGYFLHGSWYFTSARNSVRMRHLAVRPGVSATHLPGEELAIVVHGRAWLFDLGGPDGAEVRQAMLDHYLPLQGPSFEQWLDQLDGIVGGRIDAEKMFTFATGGLTPGCSSPSPSRPSRVRFPPVCGSARDTGVD
jgi:Pyridoxamine 5'-phosphate oxidase